MHDSFQQRQFMKMWERCRSFILKLMTNTYMMTPTEDYVLKKRTQKVLIRLIYIKNAFIVELL